MPENTKPKEDYKKKTSANTGKKAGNIENQSDYQEDFEGGHSLSAKDKFKVLKDSLKVKARVPLVIYVIIPVFLSIISLFFNYLTVIEYTGSNPIFTAMEYYTSFIFLSIIPEIIVNGFNTEVYTYQATILSLFVLDLTSGDFYLPMVYMFFSGIVSVLVLWMVTGIAKKDLMKSPLTEGEFWLKKYEKAYAMSNQSQRKSKDVLKDIEDMNLIKPLIKAVNKKYGGSGQYSEKFRNFLPAFRFFFNKTDSIRANMLAGNLNQRWENKKRIQQEIQTQEKFFHLIDSGYGFGKTKRDDVKKSILKEMRYSFFDNKKAIFHNKEDLFKKENKRFLKRNLIVLLSVTMITKNQILAPLYRFLKEKHKITFNRSEKQFISSARIIYESYVKNGDRFNESVVYDGIVLSLQYDYPYIKIGNKMRDVSLEVSKSINDLSKLQQSVIGNINEVDSLLPSEDNKFEPNSSFKELFKTNLNNIQEEVSKYIHNRIKLDPAIQAYNKGLSSGVLKEKISHIVRRDLIENLIYFTDSPESFNNSVDKEKKEMGLFRNGVVDILPIQKLPVSNEGTYEVYVQLMSWTSYGFMKKELKTMSLGYINHIINNIYSDFEIRKSTTTVLEKILKQKRVYNSFDSVSDMMNEKELELKNIK